jgi:hypothetical protein
MNRTAVNRVAVNRVQPGKERVRAEPAIAHPDAVLGRQVLGYEGRRPPLDDERHDCDALGLTRP